MRVVHTSDWHLGHTLRGEVSREHEHACFLRWLLDACASEAADALIITGDVFDSATPPASAEKMWFEFLAAARRARPVMDIVAIAGNHDSPARLGASSSVLRELGVHVIGGLDRERVLIPIAGGRGLVAAVPFLRPVDLRVGDSLESVYAEVLGAARAARRPGQALIATGHLYMAGADAEYLSERRVSVGGQESASARMFGDDIDYVALGHIHRAQRVGRETVRYAGAPIPLSLDEARYRHQIAVVDFGEEVAVRALEIPRAVEIVHVRGSLDDVLRAVAAFGVLVAGDPARPYLEINVVLEKPEPKLRAQIETALDGKHPRLIRLGVELTGDGAALGDRIAIARLAELDPRDVFGRLWARDHAAAPDCAVLDGFERLLAHVRGDGEDLAS